MFSLASPNLPPLIDLRARPLRYALATILSLVFVQSRLFAVPRDRPVFEAGSTLEGRPWRSAGRRRPFAVRSRLSSLHLVSGQSSFLPLVSRWLASLFSFAGRAGLRARRARLLRCDRHHTQNYQEDEYDYDHQPYVLSH